MPEFRMSKSNARDVYHQPKQTSPHMSIVQKVKYFISVESQRYPTKRRRMVDLICVFSPFNYGVKIGEDAPKGRGRATPNDEDGEGEDVSTQLSIEPSGSHRRSKRTRDQSIAERDELSED